MIAIAAIGAMIRANSANVRLDSRQITRFVRLDDGRSTEPKFAVNSTAVVSRFSVMVTSTPAANVTRSSAPGRCARRAAWVAIHASRPLCSAAAAMMSIAWRKTTTTIPLRKVWWSVPASATNAARVAIAIATIAAAARWVTTPMIAAANAAMATASLSGRRRERASGRDGHPHAPRRVGCDGGGGGRSPAVRPPRGSARAARRRGRARR